jgi:hypothetical protein
VTGIVMAVNPYSPTNSSTAEAGQSEKIVFEGSVDVDDLAALIRVPRILQVMRLMAILILTPMLALPVVILCVEPAEWAMATTTFLFMAFLSGTVLAADRMASRKRRAVKLYAAHPELIGPLRGQLDINGITFFSAESNEFCRISWSAFHEVTVNVRGIRLDWRTRDYSFIAIPSRCIESFVAKSVRAQIRSFQTRATDPPIYEAVPDWATAPPDAIRFQTLVPIYGDHYNANRLWMWLASVAAVVLVVASVISVIAENDTYLPTLIVAAVVSAGIAFITHENRFQFKLSWRQWGWFTPQGGQSHLPGVTWTFEWSKSQSMSVDDDHLAATFADESCMSVRPADLISGEWSTLVGWVREG